MKSSINRSLWIVFVFLLILGVEFFVYSLDPVLSGDEAAYCYILDWEHNGWGFGYGIGEDMLRIQTVGDVISSQIDHYHHWGGRNLVHAVEQLFSGVLSPRLFYVINTFVFLLTLTLIVYVGAGKDKMHCLTPWLLTSIGMIYFLPWSLYIISSINLACNYLWPMCGLLIVTVLWQKARKHERKYNTIQCMGLALISFIAGWSHEAYCLGLSGAFFFYYLFHFKEFKGVQIWIVIGYWLGTLVLFSAPGNFFRLTQGESKGLSDWVIEFALALPRLKLAYIFMLVLLYFRIKRKEDFVSFCKEYKLLIIAWGLSFVFVCFMHTVSQSFTGIEMLSLLLTICLLRPSFTGKRDYISALLMLILCIHIGFVSVYEFKQNKSEREALERYSESQDGLAVNYTKQCSSPIISFLLRHPMDNFRRYPLTEKLYADNPNPLILITPQDEMIMQHPDEYFIKANNFGDGSFYAIEGCSKAWAPMDSTLLNQSYEWVFDTPHWYEQMSMKERVLAIIKPEAVSSTMPASPPEIIDTRYGKFMIKDIPTQRKIIGIRKTNLSSTN